MIYRINYCHKQLWLYPSVCGEPESAVNIDPIFLGSIVRKHEKPLRKEEVYWVTNIGQ
jgi:hypothetical protein